jgi:hypothetical protein
MTMLLALFSWWYGAGWARLAKRVGERVDNVLGFFSVGTLARTLFSPFRQISAGRVQGPANVQFRAFLDRLFSRFVGAFMRSLLILIGFVGALLSGLIGLVQIVLWPLVPLMPAAGLVAALMGWTF